MATSYFLNINFVCNERCVFCAAGLAEGAHRVHGRPAVASSAAIREWLGDDVPGAEDEVAIAGGEPTIHRELLAIVGLMSAGGAGVTLYTNGLRLASEEFARAVLEAGVTKVEIGLFGASAATHDAITRHRGSFERTLSALQVLGRLRRRHDFTLEVRLLVARQSAAENPRIVSRVDKAVEGVDAFSLNRLILSADAASADAAISWAEAAGPINEAASLARSLGYVVRLEALPLCVYEDENAEAARAWVAQERAAGHRPRRMRYFDPTLAGGEPVGDLTTPLALPPVCRTCDYLAYCGGVEQWYTERFGVSGLRSVSPLAATAVT